MIICKFCEMEMELFYECGGRTGLYQNDTIYKCENCGAMLIRENQGYEEDSWDGPIIPVKEKENK